MLLVIFIALGLIIITTAIHAGGMSLGLNMMKERKQTMKQGFARTKIYWISAIVLLMFLVSVAEAFIWALVYLALNAIEGLEQAFYFSMVTFTTLGYGDIVLQERWRLLASFEAGTGIIMFGWTTAIVIAAVQHAYFSSSSKR